MNIRPQTLFDTPHHVRMTAEEYLESPFSEHKSDLIEGVFVMASPPTLAHEDLVVFLVATLSIFVDRKQLGRVMSSNTAYRLSDDNVYQPDVSFISTERAQWTDEAHFPGPPDLAVEVVSPSSRQYDTVEKRINYGRFGVGEYWLIDPIDSSAVVYVLKDGELVPEPVQDGVLRSRLLDGYWLRLEWLFPQAGRSRPSLFEVARQQGLL